MSIKIVDSHCHLDIPRFDSDLVEVVARAREAGVCRIVTICNKVSEFDKVLAIAERFEEIYCSVGVHPHEASSENVSLEMLAKLSEHPKVVGIGETGLDYHYKNAPIDAQKTSFRIHIAASRETGLPLIVHSRDADSDMGEMLEEEYRDGPYPGVLHCFTAGPELAQRALDIGFYISLSGMITFKTADTLRETIRGVPLDRLLVETDAPFLAPVPLRGKRNEPSFVRHTHANLALLMGIEEEQFARVSTNNFLTLFSKVLAPE